jgi:fanconi-associated nuclease 1
MKPNICEYLLKPEHNTGSHAVSRYVRLFVRKTAAWHRANRLGYYDDISDPEAAMKDLQETRELPDGLSASQTEPIEGIPLEDFTLGRNFTFADTSDDHITTIEEAAALLSLDELKAVSKDAKVQGKNKGDLLKALCRTSHEQAGLMALGLKRSSSEDSQGHEREKRTKPPSLRRHESSRERHFVEKILAITGPCIRLSLTTFQLFERVHLVFYRSTEWTEKSLTTIILAKIARRNFPEYVVCRASNIFASRTHLLEFEASLRLDAEVDKILEFGGPAGEELFRKVIDIFGKVYPRWRKLLREEEIKEERVYESGEGGYLRRFTPVHPYTRIVHKATYCFGRLKDYEREHSLLTELLDQRLFHMARRGGWYQRKALLEEHYMHAIDLKPRSADPDQQKKHWKRIAVATCEAALMDNDCHTIYHYDLQKRLLKLEKQLRVPRRLQHDFDHVRLNEPVEHTVEGIQLRQDEPIGKLGKQPSTKTLWVDEREGGGECSVEEMCLSWYRSEGWKGYHSEGGIVRTLFAYLFYDILFLYIPNVFQTAFQTCPLDLITDSFYPTRASEINHRLVEIGNGGAERIIREVDAAQRERRTCVVGLNWDFDLEDLVELVSCFDGAALAAVCKVMAQEYRHRGGGIPDLVLWRVHSSDSGKTGTGRKGECMFAEVKSANDRLSDTQRLWIHVLTGAGVVVALCNAVAKEVRTVG